MAKIAVAPLVLKDVLLSIGSGTPDDFAKHVSSVVFEPSSSTVSWQGLSPDASFTDQTAETWTCKLTFAQDWTTTNSLAKYLLTNKGKTMPCTCKPNASATTPVVVSANIILTPPSIGGDVNKVMEATVTLGVVGAPTVA